MNATKPAGPVLALISANSEWRAITSLFPEVKQEPSPYGSWFETRIEATPVVFLHGGWGKISAAASTQYAISRWNPRLLVNLGTCGGLQGQIEKGEILLVEETLVYDIFEQMGDAEAALATYCTHLDLAWLREPFPAPVRRGRLVSADRDIFSTDVAMLKERYHAVAADWESGAIAWVAGCNNTRCLILRGVTDLVGETGGEAYGQIDVFHEQSRQIMTRLVEELPGWLRSAGAIAC